MKKILILFLAIVLIAGGISACSGEQPAETRQTVQSYAPGSQESQGAGNTTAGNTGDPGDSSTSAGTEGKEAQYYPNPVAGYKTVNNDMYAFWFDLPEAWKAVDRSQNGDGYYIVTDAADMDIRAYGVMEDSNEEEYYRKLSGTDGTIEDFVFNDGVQGKKILNASSRAYFLRLDGDSYICFYVNYKNDTQWYEENIDKLTAIAASLRTRMEGPKLNSGANKITMEDLKLGEISIDMPYKEVKNVVKAKLTNETTDELGATTLFYDDGTEIYIIDDTVYTVNVNNENYSTPKGLKVGDDRNRVKELYGDPDNVGDDTHWGYTYDGYELLSIIFSGDEVSEIQIDMVR